MTKIEPYYQARAKFLVDSLFDNKLFRDDVTRDKMQAVEDLIAFEYQSSADTAQRLADFHAKHNLLGVSKE